MSIVDVIAEGFRTGLPHPGNPELKQPARTLVLPGMNFRGIPPEMMEKFAQDAGLPSADFPKLLAEALVHLIEKNSWEIVERVIPEETPPVEHVWKRRR